MIFLIIDTIAICNKHFHLSYIYFKIEALFAGPWDPSSWLGQIQQLQPPYAYNFPGSLNYCSTTPTVPNCLTSVEHSFQRGIIRPPGKLSQKHQQLWEAQVINSPHLHTQIMFIIIL